MKKTTEDKQQVVALILAAGDGSRMGSMEPKQFTKVGGEVLLVHTLRAFEQHQDVNAIYVVCAPTWREKATIFIKEAGINKVKGIVDGGETGFASLYNGIRHLQGEQLRQDTIVMVHDAVRPLVTQEVITGNIRTCLQHGNAITAMESNEAYICIGKPDSNTSDAFIPREAMQQAQTPHTFRLEILSQILKDIQEKGVTHSQSLFTLANELGYTPLYLTPGDILNFKVTHPKDMEVLRIILEKKNR